MRSRTRTLRIVRENGSGVEEFGIYPAASILVKQWVSRGVDNGTIHPGEDVVVCSAAIIASAVSGARNRGSRMISTADVRDGWKDILAYDLCTQPWLCLARSVTGRLEHVRDRLPMLDQLIDQLK